MSCNGCRVLRKGCTEDCTIRPCLQWIKSPDSQANATLFLAKFYGRAGLINLIEASPHHLRPATFRSLLYEACGRIVCPVNGCTGLIWSGNWAQCHAAVDAVLAGSTIITSPAPPSPTDARAAHGDVGTFKSCNIRHVSKDKPSVGSNYSAELNRIRNRIRFKQSAPPSTSDHLGSYNVLMGPGDRWNQLPGQMGGWFESTNSNSSGSWLGQRLLRIKGDNSGSNSCSSSKEDSESFFSGQTLEDSLMKMDRVLDDVNQGGRTQGSEIELDLTLGLSPIGF